MIENVAPNAYARSFIHPAIPRNQKAGVIFDGPP
jgi:hypothetical protein